MQSQEIIKYSYSHSTLISAFLRNNELARILEKELYLYK